MKKATLLFVALAFMGSFAHARTLEVHGFVEPAFTSEVYSAVQTFTVEDGALYFSGDYEGHGYMLDLPYDIGSTSAAVFFIPTAKVQAYVYKHYNGGFFYKLGKFDKIFGYEKNDGKDIAYPFHGLIYNSLPYYSHMGLKFGYKKNGLMAAAMIANNMGVVRLPNGNNKSFDYAVKLGYKKGKLFVKDSFIYTKLRPKGTNIINDLTAGYGFGKLMAGAEFFYMKNSNNTKSALTFGLFLNHGLTEHFYLNLRGEYLSDQSFTLGNTYSAYQVSVGPEYKANDHFKFKTAYAYNSAKASKNAKSVNKHIFGLSAVFEF